MSERLCQPVQYTDFAQEHVDGVMNLHLEVFPVRYTRLTIEHYLKQPDIIAVVAFVEENAEMKVVGFISCRIQDSDSFFDLIFSKKQPCKYLMYLTFPKIVCLIICCNLLGQISAHLACCHHIKGVE